MKTSPAVVKEVVAEEVVEIVVRVVLEAVLLAVPSAKQIVVRSDTCNWSSETQLWDTTRKAPK